MSTKPTNLTEPGTGGLPAGCAATAQRLESRYGKAKARQFAATKGAGAMTEHDEVYWRAVWDQLTGDKHE